MADILILKGDRPNESSSAYNTWDRLRQRQSNDTYFLGLLADIVFVIRNGNVQCLSITSGRDLASYDLVYIRDIGDELVRNALAYYLHHHGKRFINEESLYFGHKSKLTQYVAFALNDIAVPDTIYAPRHHARTMIERFHWPLPMVAKAITGSNGRDNFLVHAIEELDTLPIEQAVFQPFIPNNFDYRVIVADGEVAMAYKRIRNPQGGDYRNNVAKGATRQIVADLPPEVALLAIKAAQVTRRNLGGVDVIRHADTGAYMVLEVNYNFGMTDLGDNLAASYYETLATYLHQQAVS